MPVHDWTRVVAGNFHDFHHRWITYLSDALNGGVLPDGYYAMAEQYADGPKPDILALERSGEDDQLSDVEDPERAVLLTKTPPRVRFTEEAERESYADLADRVTVRHRNGDHVVAHIEIASPGNKDSVRRVEEFIEKLAEELEAGTHLLVIDVLPPTAAAPRGIHAAFWEYWSGAAHGVTEDQPLGLSAYRADRVSNAYFEPIGIGDPLPNMPLFLTPKHYVNVPLERSYMEAWRGVPQRWKEVLDPTSK